MLRQVYIYYQNEQIFSHFFARAYDNETLNLIITKKINTFITNPAEGQVFNKPMFEFQAHYGMFKGVFFLYVTDMADRPKVISKEMERGAKLFQKNFPNPLAIKGSSPEKEEFTSFIRETHYYLHPKIALMGGLGSGKSTIASALKLKEDPDKLIMNFAVYYQIQIRELYFDLWDFVDPDDFSMLWNNYIRGTDMIFYILDSSALNDRKEEFFINLYKREGKYSRMAVILTHADNPKFTPTDKIKEKYAGISELQFYEIDLTAPDAKQSLVMIISDAIGLKKPLPPEFRTKLIEANENVSKENYDPAIKVLSELVQMTKEYQELAYATTFESKIAELKEKLEAKKLREEQEKSKISAPKQIQFEKFRPKVATLPGGKEGPSSNTLKPQFVKTPMPKAQTVPSMPVPKELPKPTIKDSIQPESASRPAEKEIKEEKAEGLDSSLLSDVSATNPFFGGLKPLSATSLTPAKIPELPIEEENQPAEHQQVVIHSHAEFKKPAPIDIDALEGKPQTNTTTFAEKILEQSMMSLQENMANAKKLTFERSPLIKNEVVGQKVEIAQTKPITAPKNVNPLDSFTLKKAGTPISEAAEKLGEEIRNLGEGLSRELCQKFIEQLQIRLKKSDLNNEDIQKAADLYVKQRRKIQEGKTA